MSIVSETVSGTGFFRVSGYKSVWGKFIGLSTTEEAENTVFTTAYIRNLACNAAALWRLRWG
jgi:hypothetical protein